MCQFKRFFTIFVLGSMIFNLSLFAQFNFADSTYNIRKIPSDAVITIDGKMDEPVWQNITFDSLGFDSTHGAPDREGDFRAWFASVHDGDFLYYFFRVHDDTLMDDAIQAHRNDSWEIYIDGLLEKSTRPNSSFQITIQWNRQTTDSIAGGRNPDNYDTLKEYIELMSVTTDAGWDLEVSIPMVDFNIVYDSLGYELAYNDSDEEGERNHHVWFYNTSNAAWYEAGWWPNAVLDTEEIVAVEENSITPPEDFTICQNYPNPFNPETKISFEIMQESQIVLTVFNIKGQQVDQLIHHYGPGQHEIQYNAALLVSGIYIYTIEAENQKFTGKMVYQK